MIRLDILATLAIVTQFVPTAASTELNDYYVMQQAEFIILCDRRAMVPTLVRITAKEPGTYTIPNVSSVCAGKA